MQLRKLITSWILLITMILSLTVLPVAAIDTVTDGAESQSEAVDGVLDAPNDEEEIKVIEHENENVTDQFNEEFVFVFDKETESEIAQPKGYVDNIEFLSALGLYSFNDRIYNESVKRSEFARMVMELLGADETLGSGEIPFKDVNSETENSDAIRYVYNFGLMNGVSIDSFSPESSITYMQALKTVLNALGYEDLAMSQGGYPTGYMKFAQKLGLMKNVRGNHNGPLTFESAAVLLCHAAETELCEVSSISSTGTYYEKDSSRLLINVYHDIYTDRGIMTDNGRTSVNRKSALYSDKVIIGGRTLTGGTNRIKNLIGRNLTYYYKNNGGIYTLLYAHEDPTYNNIVTLHANQIRPDNANFSKTCLVADVNHAIRNYKIDVYANLIYNGIFDETFTKNSFKITEGTITLIDADNDSDYELVCVEEYMDIVVGNHIKDDRISSFYSVPGYSSISYKDCDIVIFEDVYGNEIPAEEIFSKNVLSVYRSKDNKMIRFVQSAEKASIRVDSYYEDYDELVVEYDGKKYNISNNYIELMKNRADSYPQPELGTSYDIYLNFENRIVMFEKTFGKKQYAYLLTVAHGKGFESDDVKLRMHLETDDTVIVTAKDRITINGEEGKDPNELFTNTDLFVDGNFVPQLVCVVLNQKGMLVSIETDNDANDDYFILDPNGDGVIDAEEKEKIDANKDNYSVRYRPGKFSLDYYSGVGVGGAQYKAVDFVSVNGCVCVTEDTKIFLIRHNNSNLQTTDAEEIDIITYGEYIGGWLGNSTIKAYDTDITWAAGAAVVTETYVETWSLFFVNEVGTYTDDDGNTKRRISGFFGPYGYYAFREYDEDIFKNAVQSRYPGSDGRLNKGDVLMLGFSVSQDVAKARLLYSPERDTNPDFSFIELWNNSNAMDKINRMCVESMLTMGRLCTYRDGRFGILTKGDPSYVPIQGFNTKPMDNATDTYWVHSADKSTIYYHYDCQTRELKEITQYDIAANCDFYTDGDTSSLGGYGLANFANYAEDTKFFLLRQNGIIRFGYLITGGNW